MPELPEVENVRLGIKSKLPSTSIKSVEIYRPDLRFPLPSQELKALKDSKIDDIQRRGKFLIFKTRNQDFISHLGMTGHWRFETTYNPLKHDHILFNWNGISLIYNDPRRFGYFTSIAENYFDKFGPDPLLDKITPQSLSEKAIASKTNIKTWLMNQNNILGIGNIYASEILFKSKINPLKITSNISSKDWQTLLKNTKSILNQAIKQGGSSLRDYRNVDGASGNMQNHWKVYGRSGLNCKVCKGEIQKSVIATRATYFCKTCQK